MNKPEKLLTDTQRNKVRIDDKISRIMNSGGEIRKNDAADLMGYLALLSVSQNWLDFSDLID